MPTATLRDIDSPPQADMRAFLDALRMPGATQADGLSLRYSVATGRVDIAGRGFWSLIAVERHFRELQVAADGIHARGVPARVLVDMRGAAVQATDSARRIEWATRTLWRRGDRIAVVLQSALVSMQFSRVLDDSNHRLFATIDEAEAWLAL